MTTKTNTGALVNETLSKDEVMALLDGTLSRKGTTKNYLSIFKGEYTTWDEEVHMGYIVCHHLQRYVFPEPIDGIDLGELLQPKIEELHDYYFMEVTLEEVDNPMGTSHLWKPTFHKLLPITANYLPKPVLPETGGAEELTQYIVDSCCKDTWRYTEVPMTKEEIEEGKKRDWLWYTHHTTKAVSLTYNDIYGYWSTPLTEEEQQARVKAEREYEAEILARFSNGELPKAEDDAWYSVLSMGFGTNGYDLEQKVIKILKNRGYSVRIDGERDSFGWVTRGIWVNNKMMCIY